MNTDYALSKEVDLASFYLSTIQPFWKQQVIQGQFDGKGGVSIAYAYVLHPQAAGCVVISSGRIEGYLKYKEVIYDLYQNGYSVFIHDHRGQGLSGRMTDNIQMGYVDDFFDYVTDFQSFMDKVVLPNSQIKPALLCHSMGGAIGALMCMAYPKLFAKVVFSAPMFGIRPALPNWLSTFLLKSHFALNKQASYFAGQKDYISSPFLHNDLTHSTVRYQIFRQEYEEVPKLQLGGVTGHWLAAATKAMNYVEEHASSFPIPALVMQAGADTVVDNKRQTRVVDKMLNTQLRVIQGAKHELLEEKDQYRAQCLNYTLDFFAE